MTHHGQLNQRGIDAPHSLAFAKGKFGRLFPFLDAFMPDPAHLDALGAVGGPMDAKDVPGQPNNANLDNPRIAAGFTFLGQFLDHDITFDPSSSLQRQHDPEGVENFRTPVFELDSVYGSGPGASPHLYDKGSNNTKLLLDAAAPKDLPRNSQLTALIGDPRNDENLIVSQLHLAFIKFHNAIVDSIGGSAPNNGHFLAAQKLVRFHYQWIILHQFLPLTVGQSLVDDILKNGRKFYNWRNAPFIPVEFAVAAYRFGHSQVRPGYRVNADFAASIFRRDQVGLPDPDDLSGGKRADRRFVDWPRFFDFGGGAGLQPGKLIDPTISTPLLDLPFIPANQTASLASRNLLRGRTFGLPSGQAVAQAMGEDVLSQSDLAVFKDIGGFDLETPLWAYILQEAKVAAGGKHLGPVGGRIVAEVFIGLLQGDAHSYLRVHPKWEPEMGAKKGEFTMQDLLRIAGVTEDAGAARAVVSMPIQTDGTPEGEKPTGTPTYGFPSKQEAGR